MGLLTSLMKSLPEVEQLVRLGFLKAESAAEPRNVKAAYTRYKNALAESPALQRRASMLGDTDITYKNIGQRNILNPEDLFKGNYNLVNVSGDRTAAGRTINKVSGLDVGNVDVGGGALFGLENAADNKMWASTRATAEKKQRQFDEAGKENPVAAVYTAMGDLSNNFAAPITQVMINGARKVGVPKKVWKELDNEMWRQLDVYDKAGDLVTKGEDRFVGFSKDFDSARSQLLGIDGYPKRSSGALRTVFVGRAGKANFLKQGFPSRNDVVEAATEMELRGVPIGTSGFSIMQASPGSSLLDHVGDLSYDAAMRGKPMGGTEFGLPLETMYPDMYKTFEGRVNKNNKPLTRQEIEGSFVSDTSMSQPANQQWLDGVQTFMENKKRLAALGLTAASGFAGAEESQPDLADPEANAFQGDQGAGVSPMQAFKGMADTGAGLLRGAVTEAMGVPNSLVGLGGGIGGMMSSGSGGLLERFGQGAERAQNAVKGVPILGQSAEDWSGLLPRLTSMSGMSEDELKKLQQFGSNFSPF
ncbi:MAG: hypothetical protein ACKVJD_12265 [Burkholderiales bacterium]